MNRHQPDKDDADIFTPHSLHQPSKALIFIACVAALFCAFIFINTFLNIDFNSQKNKTDNIHHNILFENVSIIPHPSQKNKYTLSGRLINKNILAIKDPVLKVVFSDCTNEHDCLIIGQHAVSITQEKIPSLQARDFSTTFDTGASMQAKGILKTSWQVKTVHADHLDG